MNKKTSIFSWTQPNPTHYRMKIRTQTQPNPTHGLTQPMSISDYASAMDSLMIAIIKESISMPPPPK